MAVVVMRSGKDRRRTCKRLQPGNGQADGMAIAGWNTGGRGVWSPRKQRMATMDGD